MKRSLLLALFAGGLSVAMPAQKPAEPKPDAPTQKLQKLAEWPKLTDSDRAKIAAHLGQFRKDERFHAGARDGLIAMGDKIAPLLFQQVSDRDENINEPIFGVLDTLLGPQHGALLAREGRNSRVMLRRYVALRLCKLFDPELQPVLESMAKDKDDEVAFRASVGLLALGDKEALPAVLRRVRSDWNGCRDLLAEVLPHARSAAAGSWALDIAQKAQAIEQMNALRLMRYLGTKDHMLALKGYLSSEDNIVKKEAINALRVIHGEPPIENMAVFQAIELAKQWQGK